MTGKTTPILDGNSPMGYKSKGTDPNRINHNRCQKKYKGARPNGPPSPFTLPMRLFMEENAHKMSQDQMLEALGHVFGVYLNKHHLKSYLTYHPLKFAGKQTDYKLNMPAYKPETELEKYLDDPLAVADQLPLSAQKEYEKLYAKTP